MVKRILHSLPFIGRNIIQKEGKYPLYASFKVTDICHLRCSCCDMWREKNDTKLKTGEITDIMRKLADSSIFALCYEGGEPLLRDDIETLVKFGRKMPYVTSMVTAGIDPLLLRRCSRYLNFVHLSIDEFHENESMLGMLRDLKRRLECRLIIHTVVNSDTLGSLEPKVKFIASAGLRICIMPAARLNGIADMFPDTGLLKYELNRLNGKYPGTIITGKNFLDSITGKAACSTSSIIIDSDGGLYYPCRPLKEKPVYLQECSLMDYIGSREAEIARERMALCSRACGWYQYFAVSMNSWKSFYTEVGDLLRRVIY